MQTLKMEIMETMGTQEKNIWHNIENEKAEYK